jgi:hypothetical protein
MNTDLEVIVEKSATVNRKMYGVLLAQVRQAMIE